MMTRRNRYFSRALVIFGIFVPAMIAHAQTISRQPIMNKTGWRTHCFGRYLVDLPPQAVIRTSYKVWGDPITYSIGKTPESLKSEIRKREAQLKAIPHKKLEGSLYVRRVSHQNGSVSLISWKAPFSKELMWMESFLVATDPSRVFHYEGDISPDKQETAVALADSLAKNIRSRADNEIPTGPGFCIDQGFIAGNDYRSESVQVGITLPQHPNAFISFDASTGAEEDRLLERVDNFLAKAVSGPLAGLKVLRKRERNVGAIPAEEYATAATGNGQRVYVFAWESQGKNKSLSEQNVSAGLRVLEQPLDSPQTPYQPAFQSDDEALQLWDAIIDSIRLRPGAA